MDGVMKSVLAFIAGLVIATLATFVLKGGGGGGLLKEMLQGEESQRLEALQFLSRSKHEGAAQVLVSADPLNDEVLSSRFLEILTRVDAKPYLDYLKKNKDHRDPGTAIRVKAVMARVGAMSPEDFHGALEAFLDGSEMKDAERELLIREVFRRGPRRPGEQTDKKDWMQTLCERVLKGSRAELVAPCMETQFRAGSLSVNSEAVSGLLDEAGHQAYELVIRELYRQCPDERSPLLGKVLERAKKDERVRSLVLDWMRRMPKSDFDQVAQGLQSQLNAEEKKKLARVQELRGKGPGRFACEKGPRRR